MMNNSHLFTFIVISTAIGCVLGSPRYVRYSKRGGYFCGKKLDQALLDVCDGRYNSSPDKKSISAIFDPNEFSSAYANDGFDDSLQLLDYLAPRNEDGFGSDFLNDAQIKRKMKQTVRITDECCSKPCTMATLASYCELK